MNRVDPFLVLVLVLLSGSFVTYKSVEYHFSGIEMERQKNEQLVHQIQQLQLKEKVAELERKENSIVQSQSRSLASIAPVTIVKPSVQDHNKELLDSSEIAKSYYEKAKLNCEKYKKEDVCTKNIEVVVSQFPETRWAGESLLLLGKLYLKTRQNDRAREVMNIVAHEFKADKEIQRKLYQLERSKQ